MVGDSFQCYDDAIDLLVAAKLISDLCGRWMKDANRKNERNSLRLKFRVGDISVFKPNLHETQPLT